MALAHPERHPGLGGTFLCVYGITRGTIGPGISETGGSTLPHRVMQKAVNALRRRIRRRPPRA
jgi:hypothetical protein